MIYYVNSSSATSPNTMDGLPARWIMLIHQLHVAGEEGGSATILTKSKIGSTEIYCH